MSPLKILIFDGSFKTTAFINRLAAGLAKRHQSIFVTQGGNRFLKLVDKKIINQVQVYTLYKFNIPFFKKLSLFINKFVSKNYHNPFVWIWLKIKK